ncbi:hypothetical protein S245_041279 [Arachis hypogaea]
MDDNSVLNCITYFALFIVLTFNYFLFLKVKKKKKECLYSVVNLILCGEAIGVAEHHSPIPLYHLENLLLQLIGVIPLPLMFVTESIKNDFLYLQVPSHL